MTTELSCGTIRKYQIAGKMRKFYKASGGGGGGGRPQTTNEH